MTVVGVQISARGLDGGIAEHVLEDVVLMAGARRIEHNMNA